MDFETFLRQQQAMDEPSDRFWLSRFNWLRYAGDILQPPLRYLVFHPPRLLCPRADLWYP